MKKFAVLLAAIGLAATASLANADTAQLELMPKVDGIEMTQYVDEGSVSIKSSEAFYSLGTGGVSPQ
jgi:hypothetical protein